MEIPIKQILEDLNIDTSFLPEIQKDVLSQDYNLRALELYFLFLKRQCENLFKERAKEMVYLWKVKKPWLTSKDNNGNVTYIEYKTYTYELKYRYKNNTYGFCASVHAGSLYVASGALINLNISYKNEALDKLPKLVNNILQMIKESTL